MTDEARRALLFVAGFRAKHGYGPTWWELRVAMGWWPREETEVGYQEFRRRVKALYPYGLRWRHHVERSLDVEPRALEALLRELRKERAA